MRRALASDWVKMRRTWILPLVALGPAGVVLLTALRYAAGYRGIVVPGASAANWALLIQNTGHLQMPALVLGVALLAALLAGLDHDGQVWKQLLAAPVPRGRFYLSKAVWLAALLGAAATLSTVGTLLLGFALGFRAPVPWGGILVAGYYPYLAAWGIMGIQLFLSLLGGNQALALTLGVVGMIMSGLSDALAPAGIAQAAHWAVFVPWVYPSLSAITHGAVQHPQALYVFCGLAVGAACTLLGSGAFAARGVR
jgi:hypothetical protein